MADDKKKVLSMSNGVPDTVIERVIEHIHDSRDLKAVSMVCRRWCDLEAESRKHVTIPTCYAWTPMQLWRRFPNIESIKLKGKARAAMFNIFPENWGGYVTPWLDQNALRRLIVIHFRRMVVTDSDLQLLAQSRPNDLKVLNLDMCSGFSTDGLLQIARYCSGLTALLLEESRIIEKDGEWLHELALKNTVLESLNFYLTHLENINLQDLELLTKNCPSLVSMKINDSEILDLAGLFRAASALQEFDGGSVGQPPEKYTSVSFPQGLCHLGITYLGMNEMHIVFPFASQLRKLNLAFSFLDTEGHCVLIQRCPNLEILQTRDVIGDRGLEVVALYCRKLKRLRIERGADEQGLEDVEGMVTHRGLTSLANGCLELEYLAVHVTDITNSSLESIGTNLKKLCDFRLVLLQREEKITDLPLDNGVRALLMGCHNLRRFALYLRPGGLSDVGLTYVGQYSQKVEWMLLGFVGDTDAGLLEFSSGCPSLKKLEMRGCRFSEEALARAVLQLTSLRYIWVHGYQETENGRDISTMVRPFWNIELIPSIQVVDNDADGEPIHYVQPSQILAYYSLAGQRTDFPEDGSVVPFDQSPFGPSTSNFFP